MSFIDGLTKINLDMIVKIAYNSIHKMKETNGRPILSTTTRNAGQMSRLQINNKKEAQNGVG